ncbi:MAG: DUF2079 domain-containing protein [Actinomycetota bacterium]|nr:DUF2079 domain-containing protein [Actinomycetota bacterium]
MRRWFRILALLAAGVQFTVLLEYSVARFDRYDLGIDFGILNQATSQIASGNLNPYSTIYGHPYWRDQFNLITWPLGFLRVVFPSAFLLLVIQGLALAVASFLVIDFTVRHTYSSRLGPSHRILVVAAVAALTLANPYAWQADSFDVHVQPIAAVGLVLAMIGFWERRKILPWVGLGLALISGSESALLVVGLGLGMVAIRSVRRAGLQVTTLGAAWLVLVMALDAHQGTPLPASYGYLAHSTNQSALSIVVGTLTHPSTPLAVLRARGAWIARIFIYSGIIGAIFPPALGASLVVIGANGLQATPSFITLQTGFQNYPETILLLAAFPIASTWLHSAAVNRRHWLGGVVVPATAALSLLICVSAVIYDAGIPPSWLVVPRPAAAALDRVPRLPAAEYFASASVIGRFSSRANVIAWISEPSVVPVCSSKMVVVLADGFGLSLLHKKALEPFAARLSRMPQAHLLIEQDAVYAFELSGLKRGDLLEVPSAQLVKPNSPISGCQA